MSVQELAMRNTGAFQNECSNKNPIADKIVDVDCVYADGKFTMLALPCPLPSIFTIRFTAPADYTQGDVIVIRGVEMPLRVPAMVSAASNLFRAGAVFHCDIDMDREIAFAWQNTGGGMDGSQPNISYDEQFAGRCYSGGNRADFKLTIRLYYTCTDR